MRLSHARLKIKRAEKHIFEFKSRIAAMLESDVATVEINPQGGNEVIKHDLTDKTALEDLAVIIGDAAHNLKSALDYAWLQTTERLGISGAEMKKFRKFPVLESKHALKCALEDRKIHLISPALFDLMLNEICPYDGGNSFILDLHRANIRDKHRLLIPVFSYVGFRDIETEKDGEVFKEGYTLATRRSPPWYIPMPVGVHVRKKGKLSFAVHFGEDIIPHHQEVVETLPMHGFVVLKVIEGFESV